MNLVEENKGADMVAGGISTLSRLMTNTGGPTSSRQRFLSGTTQSVLLYGAVLCADSLGKEVCRKRFE